VNDRRTGAAGMHILLPPSEAKRSGGRGLPLSARRRTHPLDGARTRVLDALTELLAGPPERAAAALALPSSVAATALAQNSRVCRARTLPALERYAGVVYDGLGEAELSSAARSTAAGCVLIMSGLLGVLQGGDPVPAYRVPAKATLPGIGVVGTFWRGHLGEVMPRLLGGGPVLDLRSSDYAAMWRPRTNSDLAHRLLSIRVLSPTPAGRLAVISFASKLGKGRLAAAVLERQAAGVAVTGADDVATIWCESGGKDAVVRNGPTGTVIELVTYTAAAG